MKKIIALLLLTLLLFCSCNKQEEKTTVVSLNFTQNWNGISVTNQDFNTIKFTNENNDEISIERLRYLISNVSLISGENHFLIDVGENSGNLIAISDVYPGNYKLKFTFGLTDLENTDGSYPDLNTASFNVPGMLGGGYHFMQFDGKYRDITSVEAPFNYHVISAIDPSNTNDPKDTSFSLNIGAATIGGNTNIQIEMDVSEWFKNPTMWNLNEYDINLMGNYDVQLLMNQNGSSVFSLVSITQ